MAAQFVDLGALLGFACEAVLYGESDLRVGLPNAEH